MLIRRSSNRHLRTALEIKASSLDNPAASTNQDLDNPEDLINQAALDISNQVVLDINSQADSDINNLVDSVDSHPEVLVIMLQPVDTEVYHMAASKAVVSLRPLTTPLLQASQLRPFLWERTNHNRLESESEESLLESELVFWQEPPVLLSTTL